MRLSIVIPVYYNEKNLKPLYDDIEEKNLEEQISKEIKKNLGLMFLLLCCQLKD